MYEHVLVPTDGSDVAAAAIEHAVDLADRYGAEVHALYVVDTDAMSLTLGAEQVDRIDTGHFGEMDEIEQRATDATGVVAERARDRGVTVREEYRGGRPFEQIVDYADDADVDLIVMGSHGRGGISRAVLGSVTERVLRATHRPVLVVDHEGGD